MIPVQRFAWFAADFRDRPLGRVEPSFFHGASRANSVSHVFFSAPRGAHGNLSFASSLPQGARTFSVSMARSSPRTVGVWAAAWFGFALCNRGRFCGGHNRGQTSFSRTSISVEQLFSLWLGDVVRF